MTTDIKETMTDIYNKLTSLEDAVVGDRAKLLTEVIDEVTVLSRTLGYDPDPEFDSERTPGDGSVSNEDALAARTIGKELERQIRDRLSQGASPIGIYRVPYHYIALRVTIDAS